MNEEDDCIVDGICTTPQIQVWDQTVGCAGCGVAWWSDEEDLFEELHPWWEELLALYDVCRLDVPQQIDLGGEA